jgi:CBS domain containing-hemolysin-like protein
VAHYKRHAAVILPLRQKGHWLLTTIILLNVILNESLPILVDDLVGGGWKAIVFSTVLVLLFGELIPDGKFPFASYFSSHL